MTKIKLVLVALMAVIMIACGPTKGNDVFLFKSPSVTHERAVLVSGSGREDKHEVVDCKDDYCGGRGGAVYPGGHVQAETRQTFTLKNAAHNPRAERCEEYEDVYDDGSTKLESNPVCRPASAPGVNQIPATQSANPSPTAP